MSTFGQMAARITASLAAYDIVENQALKAIGEMVEKQAYGKFGVYQDASGPYAAWPKYPSGNLAEITQKKRKALGTSLDDPLYRPGQPEADGQYLRDTVGHTVRGDEVFIGSTSSIMAEHERGLEPLPPRPVLGPALYEKRGEIVALVGAMFKGATMMGDKFSTVFKGIKSFDDEVPF